MLEGITVLSKETVTKNWLNTEVFGIVLLVGLFMSIIIGAIIVYTDGGLDGAVLGFVTGLFTTLLFGLLFAIIFVEQESYTTYKVLISEQVSYTEFIEKYEILDVDGLIYTIRER